MAKLKAEIKTAGFSKMLSSLARKLKELEEFEKQRGIYWEQAEKQIGEMYVAATRQRINDRSGLLSESIQYKPTGKGIEVYSDKSYFVGYNDDGKKLTYYAPFVEEGVQGIIRPKHWRYKQWKANGKKPNERPMLNFYSPWINSFGEMQEWWSLPWVRGQEGQHFMRKTSKSKKLQNRALEMMKDFAMQCLVSTELSNWRNASGNRRGINFTSAWKRVHGGKSKRR